jgi:hypothetical protein
VHDDALSHQWSQMTLDAVGLALLAIPAIGLTWLAGKVLVRGARLLAHASHAGWARAKRTRPRHRGRHRR